MTGSDDQLRPTLGYLPRLHATIENSYLMEGHRPGPTTCTTTIICGSIRLHLNGIWATGPGNQTSLFIVCLFKHLHGFAAIIARIVIGRFLGMYGIIQLYPVLPDIFEQQVKNGGDLKFLQCLGVPSVQPVPGCKVSMASLRQKKNLALQPPHIIDNTTDNGFHGFVVPGI